MVVKAVSNFSYHDLSYICVSLSQYLEFVGKLFCSILCTYSRVFYTPVPQSFVCDTSEGVNLVLKRIYSHCRCIIPKTLRHRCAKWHDYMYKVWHKIVYPQIPSIDWERHKYMTDHGMKSCNTSFKLSNSFNHHFKHLLTNTWNLWVNSFVPYFIHIIVSFAYLCLKALCVIHLQWG